MPGNPQKILVRSLLIGILLSLSSCATQKREIDKGSTATEEPAESEISVPSTSNAPPQTTLKNGQELKLVRVMDGAACNAEDQGARGLFLVYAEPNDIERVKQEKGTQIFQQFEHDIENLSLQALQDSINVINFDDNPFALDLEDALQQVVQQLIGKFNEFAEPAIDRFEANTTLLIDVVPFSPSMGFILENCNAALNESPDSM